jgi:3-oxoacyl-[acyl-carrier protein] reductase
MDATTVTADHEAVADRAVADTGRLEGWVNNAGIHPFTPFTEMTAAQSSQVVDLHLTGTFRGARAAADRMIARRARRGHHHPGLHHRPRR